MISLFEGVSLLNLSKNSAFDELRSTSDIQLVIQILLIHKVMVISLSSLTLQYFPLGARKSAVIRISFRSRISIWNSHGSFIKSFGYPTVFKEL